MANLLHTSTLCCHDGGRFYTSAISTFRFDTFAQISMFLHICAWYVFAHAKLVVMRDISIVHSNKRSFNHCLCHLEPAVIEVALRLVHRLTIVND